MSSSAKTGFHESHDDYESAGFLEATSTDTMVAFNDFIEILNDDEANEPTTDVYPQSLMPYHSMARELPHPSRTAELQDLDPVALLFMDEFYGPLDNDNDYFNLTNIVSSWNANDELPVDGQDVLSNIPPGEATAASATIQPLSDKGQVLTVQYIDRVQSTSAPLEALDHAIRDNFTFEREQHQYGIGPCTRLWQVPKLGQRRQPLRHDSPTYERYSTRSITKQEHRERRRGPYAKRRADNTRAPIPPCRRCQWHKLKCDIDMRDPQAPCQPCLKLTSLTLSSTLPCPRHKIEDASLFRDQDVPWPGFSVRHDSMEIEDIREWASPEIKSIEVTHRFGKAKYRLELRQFIPQTDDILEKTWTHGSVQRRHPVPPYAIANMKSAAGVLYQYINHGMLEFVNANIDESDKLLRNTFNVAMWWCQHAPTQVEKNVLSNALRLWAGARITSHPEEICGEELIGSRVTDPTSPYVGAVPVPPLMCAQLEVISYSALLHPFRREIIEGLVLLFKNNPRKYWFTIYLASFILLHSCSEITRRDEEFAQQMGLKLRWANPKSIVDHHVGVQTLLTYYHHTCKGRLLKVMANDLKKEQEFVKLSSLEPRLLRFIKQSAARMKQKEPHIQKIRDRREFGDKYYFVAQLFDSEWKPAPIAQLDETATGSTAV